VVILFGISGYLVPDEEIVDVEFNVDAPVFPAPEEEIEISYLETESIPSPEAHGPEEGEELLHPMEEVERPPHGEAELPPRPHESGIGPIGSISPFIGDRVESSTQTSYKVRMPWHRDGVKTWTAPVQVRLYEMWSLSGVFRPPLHAMIGMYLVSQVGYERPSLKKAPDKPLLLVPLLHLL